jgi:L-idonate 5-dehydrogenase
MHHQEEIMKSAMLYGKRDMRFEATSDPLPGMGQVAVDIKVGGICGSDMHYFQHGANGTIILKEPLVLGHEIAGVVSAVGDGVTDVTVGQKVAVNPSRACGKCRNCLEGKALHCENGTFMGSAMRTPHIQGGFRERVVADRAQAFPVPDSVDLANLVYAEPLAVCLHAVARAGTIAGKKVLVTGSGPIGNLIVALAKRAGAASIASTDLSAAALTYASSAGANITVDVSVEGAFDALVNDHGPFDVAFECSGHPTGVAASIEALAVCGVLVQVGMLGKAVTAPLGAIVVKEIDYRGTFRFDREFAEAVEILASGKLDVTSMTSHKFGFDNIIEAFDVAADRRAAMKVQIVFP